MLSTSKLSGIKISKKRLFVCSLTGGIFSLIILLELNQIQQILSKLFMGLILIILGFVSRKTSKNQFIKITQYFTVVNFIYAGIMFSIYIIFTPNIMAYKNGVVYFNITALNLVISTTVAYVIVNILIRILDKKITSEQMSQVRICYMGREVILTGLVDTGNKLTDIFTGLPVIVCEFDSVSSLFPFKLKEYFKTQDINIISESSYSTQIRLIPIKVVGNDMILPAFKPDEIEVSNSKVEALITVVNERLSNGEFSAIINANIFKEN